MKKLFFILASLLAALTLVGCGSGSDSIDVPAADIRAAINNVLPEESLPAMMEIDSFALKNYYGIGSDEAVEFSGQLPIMNVAVTEILVVRAQNGKAAAVQAAMEMRRDALLEKWNDPETPQNALIADCKIVQNGDWLLFVVAESADDIVGAFNELIDANRKDK